MLDTRWDQLTENEWLSFAKAWVSELNGIEVKIMPKLPQLFEDDPCTEVGDFVVSMNFTASHEAQWKFIKAAFTCANEGVLDHLAAGPVEHILGHYGEEYIDKFEAMAKSDIKFAKMLAGCYQYKMSDEIWARICAVRKAET